MKLNKCRFCGGPAADEVKFVIGSDYFGCDVEEWVAGCLPCFEWVNVAAYETVKEKVQQCRMARRARAAMRRAMGRARLAVL